MSYHDRFYLDTSNRQIRIEQLVHKDEDRVWANAVNAQGETPLHIAARNRNLHLFKSLLPYYTNIEATDNRGNTVLHVLADAPKYKELKNERNALFRVILSKGADINKANKNGWTPIHYAAKYRHIEMLKIAKLFNANFNLKTDVGETPLLLVCTNMFESKNSSKEIETIDFLMSYGCEINATDDEGYSALYYAIKKCSTRLVKMLLDKGADVNLCAEKHKFSPVHFSIKKHNLPLLKVLLDAGAITESQDTEELTPLQTSVIESSSNFVKYLIKNGADLNCRDRVLQLTPLHLTIYHQRRDLFKFLIGKGANVHLPDKDGLTPLHLSSILGLFEFTKILLENGAKVNSCSNNQFTPLHLVTMQNHYEENSKAVKRDAMKHIYKDTLIVKLLKFPYISTEQDYIGVIRLLLCNGADVNALTSSGWSSLHFATELKRRTDNFIKILLEHGANVNYAEPSSGFTALHFASRENFGTKVEVLINGGADVNALSKDGRTPLHLAIKPDSTKIFNMLMKYGASDDDTETALEKKYTSDAAKVLIKAGADVNLATPDDKSPVYLALESNRRDIMKLLILHGANVNHRQPHTQLTALHVALRNNNETVTAMLVNAGADVNALTRDGRSSIHIAIELLGYKSHLRETINRDIARILIDAGADVNVLAPDGSSTLHLALKSNCKQLLKFLIKSRLKLNCTRRRCLYTLLYLTAQSNDEDVIEELDDSDKTPLLSATMNEKNANIRKAIYCLSALVDATNKRSCMPLNFDVNKCCIENLTLLRSCGEYFYQCEAYNQFIIYRVLSGDFHKFSNRQFINATHPKDLSMYLFMLDAVNLPLPIKRKTTMPSRNDEIWHYHIKCKDEVRKLQKYPISEGVTLYDVLHMKPRRRRLYMNNFNLSEIADKFKIYYKLVLTYYYEDKIRSMLMETALSAFCQFTNLYLPAVCLDEIFWNLDIVNIIAIIEAVARID